MNEPKRWVEDGAPHDVEQLFRAAKAEQPDDASLGRTLTALGGALSATSVTAGAGAAGTVASGAAKLTAPITVGLLAKWSAFGLTLGTLTVGAATIVSHAPWAGRTTAPPAPPSTPAPPGSIRSLAVAPELGVSAPSPAPSVIESDTAPSVALAPKAASNTPLRAASAVPVAPTPAEVEALTEEVRQVDRARAALAVGRPAETLAALDEYERRFPQHRFAPEALYLRMEALASLGRTAQARAAAELLLATYPGTPNGARARAVLARNP
jgi:hypothetical protein